MVITFCILHGLIRRYSGTLLEHLSSKIWWIGVCADLSKTLGIHVVTISYFVMLYTPLGLGLIFYFIYYCFIINRVSILTLTPEHKVQILKIKSYYFGS